MDLQEMLSSVFNKQLDKTDCVFNWKENDLKNFSDDDIDRLIKTCVKMGDETPLASTVLKRCWNVKYKRHMAKHSPKIKPTKSKGAKRAKAKNSKPKR